MARMMAFTMLTAMGVNSATTSARAAVIDFNAYYLSIGDNPSGIRPNPEDLTAWWMIDHGGMAHGDSHWFLTQRGYYGGATIWRVPVEYNLGWVNPTWTGVSVRGIPSQHFSQGFRWFGDPCAYRYQGIEYLLVPMGGDLFAPQWYRLGVFTGDQNIGFIDDASFGGSPWCAIDAMGRLYGSSPTGVSGWRQYSVNWPLLRQSGTLSLQQTGAGTFYKENGVDIEMIGGTNVTDVTPLGDLLYILTSEQLYVFETATGRTLKRSTATSGHFHLSIGDYEQCQGFTIWDLEGTGSPHSGQLHVFVHNNDPQGDGEHRVANFSRTILVDATNTEGFEAGTPQYPMETVTAAIDLAWDGAEIRIRANRFNERVTISKHVMLTTQGGLTRIGD